MSSLKVIIFFLYGSLEYSISFHLSGHWLTFDNFFDKSYSGFAEIRIRYPLDATTATNLEKSQYQRPSLNLTIQPESFPNHGIFGIVGKIF